MKLAALFVETGGCYFAPGFEPWDWFADAKRYQGPWPVIAHPPCERWGRYWGGGPSVAIPCIKGDDDGCFKSALASVEKWGGVLEHPEASHAWKAFGLTKPPRTGGWIKTREGWTCCVAQGHYGHPAQKLTWLYAVTLTKPQPLKWGLCQAKVQPDLGYHSAEERRRAVRTGVCQRLSRRQRAATPVAFRDLLRVIAWGAV